MTTGFKFPETNEAAKKAALKDDCFELPPPGSEYARVLDEHGDDVLRKLVAEGRVPADVLRALSTAPK